MVSSNYLTTEQFFKELKGNLEKKIKGANMNFIKITEQDSNHNDLEKKSVRELVESMHEEDNNALNAVKEFLPEITKHRRDCSKK